MRAVLLFLLLAGCAGTANNCPPIVEYSKEEQAAASTEIVSLGPNSITQRMMRDYGTLRNLLRVCQKR